ncbi:site-specific integrase [Magnetospirillum fulvum]|uniref:Integrase n=1 Tax=Magnetospirillum fulvum MGU-K5 TaxID=1316936 RepID=S9SC32_MAGFU|nr:site-specific integrase [Magnetospirillum fulvum]EPY01623.1 integrase [Magnetospirillum fulvum MGU-K5]
MEKMPGHPRLYRRGAVYWHRAAVPVDIADTYPKTEETFSLRTKDHRDALKLVRIEAARVDRLFDDHRRRMALQAQPPLDTLTDEQVKRIGEVYYAALLDEDDEVRNEAFEGRSFEEYVEDIDAFDTGTRHQFARGEVSSFYEDEVDEVLSWDNVALRLAEDAPCRRKLARELQAAAIRAYKAKRARNEGEPVETPAAPAVTPPPSTVKAPLEVRSSVSTTPPLSHLVKEWIAEKARTSWVPKTEHEHRVWMGHFIAVTGDRPWTEYGKAEARAFKAILMHLPANWNKFDDLKGLTIAEASAKAQELAMAPMSEKNLNKLLGYVGSLWTWAADHYDECPPNPFKGLKVKMKGRNVREERDPFTLDELKAIFRAPVYTGCKSVREWTSPGSLIPRDTGMFWVPLIGLFTGARSGEIIQLRVEEVRTEHGVLFFDINDDGEDKRLKTPHSKRNTPVHPVLIQLGLLDHVALRKRQGEQRLFPEMKMGADGYYSSPYSKHFRRFLEAVKVKHRKNAFHSFRHSFEDACRNSDISKEIMDALQGHGEEGMSGRYGRGFFLKKLAEAMARLRYEGLDLGHLRPDVPGQKCERASDQAAE